MVSSAVHQQRALNTLNPEAARKVPLVAAAHFCHVCGPSPCPLEQRVQPYPHDLRKGSRLSLLFSVFLSLLQTWTVGGVVGAVL